jgi:hypothetical protein
MLPFHRLRPKFKKTEPSGEPNEGLKPKNKSNESRHSKTGMVRMVPKGSLMEKSLSMMFPLSLNLMIETPTKSSPELELDFVYPDCASASYDEDPNEEEEDRNPGATAAKRAALKESMEVANWHSSIIDAAVELVETYVQRNRKVVIYSEFLSACDVAQVALDEVGINTCELNGNTFVPRNGSRS